MEEAKMTQMVGDLAHQVLIMEEEIEELRRENDDLKLRLEKTEKENSKSMRQ